VIVLFHKGRPINWADVAEECRPDAERLKRHVTELLKSRNLERAAYLLNAFPFRLLRNISFFSDEEYCGLSATVPLEEYEQARKQSLSADDRNAWKSIASVFSEIGPSSMTFIFANLDMDAKTASSKNQNGLKESQVKRLVYGYIGVSGGYLGDFTYASHAAFYTDLDLDINPYDYNGTTRVRFMAILTSQPSEIQAKILSGILHRFPVNSSEKRTEELYREIQMWIRTLSKQAAIEQPTIKATSEVVRRALSDAEHLLQKSGSTSAVDRLHTALHGYLLDLCRKLGSVPIPEDANLTQVFRLLRKHHVAFQAHSMRLQDVDRILNSLASVLDAMNPLRNRGSVAHPNEVLLDEIDAQLFVNSARTILQYVEGRINMAATISLKETAPI